MRAFMHEAKIKCSICGTEMTIMAPASVLKEIFGKLDANSKANFVCDVCAGEAEWAPVYMEWEKNKGE